MNGGMYFGPRLVPAPHMVETVVGRVPGGYMNRWLIRGVSTRPMRSVIHDSQRNVIYAHPEVLEQLKKELSK